jgi:hypothetical protein
MKSKFEKWFLEQHGSRPARMGQEQKLREQINAGRRAEILLERCAVWDKRFTSALWAWNTRGEIK